MGKLQTYYESLPGSTSPKQEFVTEAAICCGVTEKTVREWVKGRSKTDSAQSLEVLSRITGIAKEDLF